MTAQPRLWEVVGGGDRGGLLVRVGQDLNSLQLNERLATGSVVVEEDLVGERLHFRLLAGRGPERGWVSTTLKDRSLLERVWLGQAEVAAASAAVGAGTSQTAAACVAQSPSSLGSPPVADAKEEDEAICRICFGDSEDGQLVAPCACSGDQRYVHMECLLRWQRMALVNQPTHPSAYDKHTLHRKCGICQQEFTTKPPTRHELMESFTGAELAAMISVGYLLATDEVVSKELERQQEELLGGVAAAARFVVRPFDHWIRSAYLITAVHEDDGLQRLPVPSQAARDDFATMLAGGISLVLKGQRFRVVRFEQDVVCLAPHDGADTNCGKDHVVAINLTRPCTKPPSYLPQQRALARLRGHCPGALQVEVSHFLGGPCHDDSVVACLVPGGSSGWSIVGTVEEALQLAHQRTETGAASSRGGSRISSGQTVRVIASKTRSDLKGKVGMALDFAEVSGAGLWRVRLEGEAEPVRLPATELEGLEGAHGRVLAFWGDARWSRVQLLGEIARGHWGLCRAGIQDIILPPARRWAALDGRLAFAPMTEMTERYLEEAKRQMTAYRAVGLGKQTGDAS